MRKSRSVHCEAEKNSVCKVIQFLLRVRLAEEMVRSEVKTCVTEVVRCVAAFWSQVVLVMRERNDWSDK
jgi:hypothetical protein